MFNSYMVPKPCQMNQYGKSLPTMTVVEKIIN